MCIIYVILLMLIAIAVLAGVALAVVEFIKQLL